MKKIFILLFITSVFVLGLSAGAAILENKESKQDLKENNYQKINIENQNNSSISSKVQIHTENKSSVNIKNSSEKPVLTVTPEGVTAFVSINQGEKFVYSAPITMEVGDKYSVTASINEDNLSYKNTCSGTASLGGSYFCSMKVSEK